jgi:hypothetical protein
MAAIKCIEILPYLQGPRGGLVIERFREKVARGAPGDCWDWIRSTSSSGYGRFKIDPYTTVHANRFALVLETMREPHGLMALHSCDRPICCNPAHLRWGDAYDNMQDKIARGRARSGDQSGERNPGSKIGIETLREIVGLIERHHDNTAIARRFGLSHSMISRIAVGRAWKAQTAAMGFTPRPAWDPRTSCRRREGLTNDRRGGDHGNSQ